jgi:hypothetical protein
MVASALRTLNTPARLATRGTRRNRPPESTVPHPWPGADPAAGPSLFLDQLELWDAALESDRTAAGAEGPFFRAAGCVVRRIPSRGSAGLVAGFLSRHHYTCGPGMRGLPFGLYRGEHLLGVAVFSRVCRPRWAGENFVLLPRDRSRPPAQRRHLSVTEAEYMALSRLALVPDDVDAAPLGKGAASWFLCRCLAALEARNRALWSAHQRIIRGERLLPEHLRLLREAAGADRGLGRGYIKCVTTWADPYENMLGRIYQILAFHYTGRTNGGRWRREAVGLRSGRRLSARTLAKARSQSHRGHVPAVLRLGWEGGAVRIEATRHGKVTPHDAAWLREITLPDEASEPEIVSALDAAWTRWLRDSVSPGESVSLRWEPGTGVRLQAFPPKHAYFTGLGSSGWYRRQTEIRHRPLTARLLAEEAVPRTGPRPDRRRAYYPKIIPPEEIRPELRRGLISSPPSRPESL